MPESKKRVCLYFKESIHKAFMEICRREGETASGKLERYMSRYVQAHSPGNPQQRLDTIMRTGRAWRSPDRCCVCAKPAEYNVIDRKGENLLYCEECFRKTGRQKASVWSRRKKREREFI